MRPLRLFLLAGTGSVPSFLTAAALFTGCGAGEMSAGSAPTATGTDARIEAGAPDVAAPASDPVVAPPVAGGPEPLDGGTYSRCPLVAPGSTVAAWGEDFSTGPIADPEGDDRGDGDYTYPADVAPGAADLTSFELTYAAARQALTVTVGVRRLANETRLGLVLWDEAHFPKAGATLKEADLEWSMTGNDLRLPSWNAGGLTVLLARPRPENPTFDLAIRENLAAPGEESRPDNTVYIARGSWLDCQGRATFYENRTGVMELDVRRTGNELSFTLPVAVLEGELDLRTPRLYAALYAYVLPDRPKRAEVEYGSLEITPALGGLPDTDPEPWRDLDLYDIAFVNGAEQASVLTPPPVPAGGFKGNDGSKLVVLKDLGRGILAIDTKP